MNIKLKAFLIALSVPLSMFLFVYTLVFHTAYIFGLALLGLIYSLYRLVLQSLEEKEQGRKK